MSKANLVDHILSSSMTSNVAEMVQSEKFQGPSIDIDIVGSLQGRRGNWKFPVSPSGRAITDLDN